MSSLHTQFCRFNRKIRPLKWKSTSVLESTLSCRKPRQAGPEQGYVVWLPDSSLPKQLLYSEVHQSKLTSERQKKWFKDCLKATLKDFGTGTIIWEALAKQGTANLLLVTGIFDLII